MICIYGITAKAENVNIGFDIDTIKHIDTWSSLTQEISVNADMYDKDKTGSERAFNADTYDKKEIKHIVTLINSLKAEKIGKASLITEVDSFNINIYYDDTDSIWLCITLRDAAYMNCFEIKGSEYKYADCYKISYNELYKFMTLLDGMKTGAINVKDRNLSEFPSDWAKEYIEDAIGTGLLPKIHAIDYQYDISRMETSSLITHCLVNIGCLDELIKSDNSGCISKLIDFGLIEGSTDNNYPDYYYTQRREYLMKDLAKPFDDTIYMPDIKVLYELGIIDGKSKNLFYPYDNITREEFAKILSKTYHIIHKDADTAMSYKHFNDEDDISEWAMDYVKEMVSLGIIEGNDAGCFLPKHSISKEEVIVSLLRLCKQ